MEKIYYDVDVTKLCSRCNKYKQYYTKYCLNCGKRIKVYCKDCNKFYSYSYFRRHMCKGTRTIGDNKMDIRYILN